LPLSLPLPLPESSFTPAVSPTYCVVMPPDLDTLVDLMPYARTTQVQVVRS